MAILEQDLLRIREALTQKERNFYQNTVVMITGLAGSLGYELTHYLLYHAGVRKIIGIDNLSLGFPAWLKRLVHEKMVDLYTEDIASVNLSNISDAENADVVFHMASVASPVSYRENPVLTMDANVGGCKNLLEYYKERHLKSFCYFSSSEIYGSPDDAHIPTKENYWGYVNCVGARSCYDEAKRYSETLCYVFARQYGIPCCILRPFNIFGAGMKLNDGRIPTDCIRAVMGQKDIHIYSDGTPTRTFCYISDAVTWILKAAAHGSFGIYNIGADAPEVTMLHFAELCAEAGRELLDYRGNIVFSVSQDKEYLLDNPLRRCPDLSHAAEALGFRPLITIKKGIRRFIDFLSEYDEEEWLW